MNEEVKEKKVIGYFINEYFQSMQGEGFFTGTPAFFLRFQGCDVGCSFCDTKYTWSEKSKIVSHLDLKENTPQQAFMTLDDIFEMCSTTKHIVVTGGEPCLQDLYFLTCNAIAKGKSIQIETSATAPIKAHKNAWVTLSPKFNNPKKKPILQECIARANEFKFPVASLEDVNIIDKFFKQNDRLNRTVWLQPISQDKDATEICLEEARKRGWRISIQTHKYLGLR